MGIFQIIISEYLLRYPKKHLLLLRAFLLYYRNADFRVIVLIRYCVDGKIMFFRKRACKKLLIKYDVAISRNTTIGKNFRTGHYLGLVIGPGTIIGDNCVFYQQVTVGQNHDRYPVIGNNVTVYAGAKIIGGIHIGNNVIVGANAVVTKDVPDNCTVAGVPAKIISQSSK